MSRRYGDITWEPADTPTGTVGVARRPRSSRRANRQARVIPASVLPTVRVDGIRVHAITEQTCIEHIFAELDAGRGGMVVTPNLDHVRRCTRDLSFGALVAEAELVVPDGMPVLWASRLQGTPLPQRVAGSDLISSLSAAAALRGRSIFLLGGDPGTAERAAVVLQNSNPGLNVCGTHCPPRGFEHNDAEMKRMVAQLVAAKADIVFVALGSPKQEYLIQRLRRYLPAAWWLGVGISFSFLAGEVRRAPRWLQKIGLEWVHRLVQDPRRLFHRYVVVGIPFGAGLMCRSIARGIPLRWGRRNIVKPTGPPVPFTIPASGEELLPLPALAGGNGNGNGNGHGILPRHALAPADSALTPAALTTLTATALMTPVSAPPSRRPRSVASSSDGSTNAAANGSLSRLRAMILLGGSVRSSPLSSACQRSVLDLPLDADGSIFNHWLLQATDLARYAGLEKFPVRVLVNRNAPEPISAAPMHYGKFRVERDLSEYRGTGGVLRDLAADYGDDDLILVCNAAQILLDPLAAIATALDKKEGDVTIVSHNDGTPSGVQLVSCKTLRTIPDLGFVDMKEQGLPLIASKYDVTVLHCRRPTALPVRTLYDYILAMRHYHRRRLGKPSSADPLAGDWQPAFAIVEQGATVDTRAHVHDSIVLRGGVVEAGAVIVRSIICPGGVVRKDRPTVDQLVCITEP
ncbi:MAG: WecB/TagA/CpsF family glycosyltransferase [Tepidisphaeraceae bacterium]